MENITQSRAGQSFILIGKLSALAALREIKIVAILPSQGTFRLW